MIRVKIAEKIYNIIHSWYSYEIKRRTKILNYKKEKLKESNN